jgi:hypothetical protein
VVCGQREIRGGVGECRYERGFFSAVGKWKWKKERISIRLIGERESLHCWERGGVDNVEMDKEM